MIDQGMRIVTLSKSNVTHLVEVEYLLSNQRHKVFYRTNGDAVLTGNCESFLAGGILPCMKVGEGQLIAEGEISKKLFSALPVIQDIYCTWDTSLHRAEITNVIPLSRPHLIENRVGAFFSGGVDSFYTLLKHQDVITDLIFVHGLDIRLSDISLRDEASKQIHEVATNFDKNVIEIETNIREFFDSYVDWGLLGHGAALAAIGHLLCSTFHRIFIPATHTYSELFPWGSHPVLDPLWSSESLQFTHDGCEATRVEKVSLIAKYDIALQTLRVCWENPNSSYNCGRCEKCLRTMINLKVNNALDRCTTFDKELNIKNILKINAEGENVRAFIKENLNALKNSRADDELERALQKVLNKYYLSHKIKRRLRTLIKDITE
jgi:hypothetical protein